MKVVEVINVYSSCVLKRVIGWKEYSVVLNQQVFLV